MYTYIYISKMYVYIYIHVSICIYAHIYTHVCYTFGIFLLHVATFCLYGTGLRGGALLQQRQHHAVRHVVCNGGLQESVELLACRSSGVTSSGKIPLRSYCVVLALLQKTCAIGAINRQSNSNQITIQ